MHFHSNYNYVSVHQNHKRNKKCLFYDLCTPKNNKEESNLQLVNLFTLFFFLSLFYLCLCSLYVVGWRVAGVYMHSGLLVPHCKLCTKRQTKIKSWIGEKTNPEWYQNKPKNDTLSSKHAIFSVQVSRKVTLWGGGQEKDTVRCVDDPQNVPLHSGGGYGFQNFGLNKIAIFLKPGREELTGHIAMGGEKGFRKGKGLVNVLYFRWIRDSD